MCSSDLEQKEIIEKQIKRQMTEEMDREEKMTNIIIKGLKDFGEKERTYILVRNFLKDEMHDRWDSTSKQEEILWEHEGTYT